MSRSAAERLADVLDATAAVRAHVQRGGLDDGLVYDAVLFRLLQIGEAVKALPESLLASEPGIPWRQIATMRDRLAHRYFDTQHAVVAGTVEHDLGPLEEAVRRLHTRVERQT